MLNKIQRVSITAQSTTTNNGDAGRRFAAKAANAKRVWQQLDDRKSDNVRRVAAVFGAIGRNDVEYCKGLHDDLVQLSKSALEEHREWADAVRHDRRWPSSSDTNNGAPLDPDVMPPSSSENDDSIFDN